MNAEVDRHQVVDDAEGKALGEIEKCGDRGELKS